MKRLLIIILFCCITFLFTGMVIDENIISRDTISILSNDNINFKDSLKEKLNYPFTFASFYVNLCLKYDSKLYAIYSFTDNDTVSRIGRDKSIKHIGGIDLVCLRESNDDDVEIVVKGEGMEISSLFSSLIPIGLYDKENDTYVVGGKVFNYSNRIFSKMQLKLKDGTTLETNLNNDGYFIFIFKSIYKNQQRYEKSSHTFGYEIEYLKAFDTKGNADSCTWQQ